MHEIKFLTRISSEYMNVDKFENKDNNFNRQYAHIYFERLSTFRPTIQKFCENHFDSIPIKRLHEVISGEKCIIIGTLVKKMKMRPTILKKIANDYLPNEDIGRFIDESDAIVIEDELQRAQIGGNIDIQKLVTGITLAVICEEDKNGILNVLDVIYPPLPFNKPLKQLSNDENYIAIVSGLGLSNANISMQTIQMLIDTITGISYGEENELSFMMQKISRLIIAGNSLGKDVYDNNVLARAKYISNKINLASFEKMEQLDSLLAQLALSINVDVMPGLYDPTNAMLPQQPLKKCLFKKLTDPCPVSFVTNPYEFCINDVRLLGTSGQNIDDIASYTNMEDALEILECTLRWCHIAPTCPDSLAGYPFFDKEPFVIQNRPHVYFAGNQKEFKWKHVKDPNGDKTLIITIPEFCQDPQLILVNLNDLSCFSIHIYLT